MDDKLINDFAKTYLKIFEDEDDAAYDSKFAEICFGLGFECEATLMGYDGEILKPIWSKHPKAMKDAGKLEAIRDELTDAKQLGTLIFSRWRLITHGDFGDLFADDVKPWFEVALKRLEEITEG